MMRVKHYARIYRGPNGDKKSSSFHVVHDITEHGTATCQVCGYEVGLRSDGSLRQHRVGTNRRNSWPCPGATERVVDPNARKAFPSARKVYSKKPNPERERAQAIRLWAEQHGYTLSPRGRIPAAVHAAYNKEAS